jgi:hypothetical protein
MDIRAKGVIDGVFTILMEGTELPSDTLKMIRDLFPHKVHDLLAIENVVHDYVPPKKKKSQSLYNAEVK